MGSHFQLLEAVHVQAVANARGQHRPYARHPLEQLAGIELTPQSVQTAPTTRGDDFDDGRRNTTANIGYVHQARRSLGFGDVANVAGQLCDGCRGAPKSTYPERIGALQRQ